VAIKIGKEQFFEIIKLAKGFEKVGLYDLCKNNCTNFALQAAEIAGIHIDDTYGSSMKLNLFLPFWEKQGGDNPASTGQSILENKVFNTNTNNQEGLIINTGNAEKVMSNPDK
jgi:hypothetical protein